MKIVKGLSIAVLALGMNATALAQQPPAGQEQGDQVDQLDQLVHLSDSQKKDIRGMMQDSEAKVVKMRMEAQDAQQQLASQIKPGFDEDAIRDSAKRLGDATGDVTAESALLQARIQDNLTEEQRATLQQKAKEQQEQMRKLQEQMQQQQQQQPQR